MAEGGQKLSKRLKNYPDPNEILETVGSEALRWFLVSSPVLKGGNVAVDKEGKEIAKASRLAMIPLWNAFYFFTLYANAEDYKAKEISASSEAMDNYILSKLKTLGEKLKHGFETYDIAEVCSETAAFMEILNNWYIRRTRERFWRGDAQAFDTLYTVLVNVAKLTAPVMPFIAEYIYKNLTGGESVHLCDYPTLNAIKSDEKLMSEMDFVQDLCSTGKFIREEKNLRNRLPLASMTVIGASLSSEYQEIVKDELNVKEVRFDDNLSNYATKSVYLYTPLLGKTLGKDMGAVMAAYKQGNWVLNSDGTLSIGGKVLASNLFEVRLDMKDGVAGQSFADNKAVLTLDTNVTDELKREGMARDFVRLVQTLRKDKDFNISDRIELNYSTADAELAKALQENQSYIADQVLAIKVVSDCAGGTEGEIEGISVLYDAQKCA